MIGQHQITVAVVDDHQLLRTQLCELLELMGLQVLFQAENGKTCLQKMDDEKLVPDVCLLDVSMPIMNSYDTAKILHRRYPKLKILAHSMNNEEKSVISMLQSGAAGYITKGSDLEELKQAIMTIYAEGYYFNRDICKILLTYLRRAKKD